MIKYVNFLPTFQSVSKLIFCCCCEFVWKSKSLTTLQNRNTFPLSFTTHLFFCIYLFFVFKLNKKINEVFIFINTSTKWSLILKMGPLKCKKKKKKNYKELVKNSLFILIFAKWYFCLLTFVFYNILRAPLVKKRANKLI